MTIKINRVSRALGTPSLLMVCCLMVIVLGVTPAEAQRARQRNKPAPTPTQPVPVKDNDAADPHDPHDPDASKAPEVTPDPTADTVPDPEDETKAIELEPTPFLKLRNTKHWTLKAEVLIQSYQDAPRGPSDRRELTIVPLDFTSATIVFPVLVNTGSSRTMMTETEHGEVPALVGEVRVNDRTVPQDMAFVSRGINGKLLPSNTWRAQWLIANPDRSGFKNVRQFDLQFELPVECSETQFDERRASAIDWPKDGWPEVAEAALEPEAFIDFDPSRRNGTYDTRPMDAMLSKWFDGNDPKKLRPVVLAKWIAGNLAQSIQVNGNGLKTDRRTSLIAGFDLQDPSVTVSTGRGSEFDMTNLLVAMYRRVGLPARVVIGYDVGVDQAGRTIYESIDGDTEAELRAWAEFCLYDEKNMTLGWIPVDVVSMRKNSSRMPPKFLQRPIKFFGTHDELDEVIPVAHQYAPANTSTSYYKYPAFWGWFVQPRPPVAGSQSIRFSAMSTPQRARPHRR